MQHRTCPSAACELRRAELALPSSLAAFEQSPGSSGKARREAAADGAAGPPALQQQVRRLAHQDQHSVPVNKLPPLCSRSPRNTMQSTMRSAPL